MTISLNVECGRNTVCEGIMTEPKPTTIDSLLDINHHPPEKVKFSVHKIEELFTEK